MIPPCFSTEKIAFKQIWITLKKGKDRLISQVHFIFMWILLYPQKNEYFRGFTGISLSVHLSVRPCVCVSACPSVCKILVSVKVLVISNFSLSHSVFERLVLKTVKKQGIILERVNILLVSILEPGTVRWMDGRDWIKAYGRIWSNWNCKLLYYNNLQHHILILEERFFDLIFYQVVCYSNNTLEVFRFCYFLFSSYLSFQLFYAEWYGMMYLWCVH